jgi:hypothetical protein
MRHASSKPLGHAAAPDGSLCWKRMHAYTTVSSCAEDMCLLSTESCPSEANTMLSIWSILE